MEDLRLSQDVAQFLTDCTMEGLTQYVKRRKEDSVNMEISRAEAWMKGNFIDNAIAQRAKEQNISFKHKMAGYSWEYLQFDIKDSQTDGMNSIIVKNFKTLKSGIQRKGNKLPDYLLKDSSSNADILRRNEKNIHATQQYAQLELLPTIGSAENLDDSSAEKENKFYVVGYTLGTDKNIETLKLLMPNPITQALVEVDDWTKYIVDAPIQPSIDDLSVLQSDMNIPESQYDDTANMKYEIANNTSKENNV